MKKKLPSSWRRPPELSGYNFPLEMARNARSQGQLLSLRVETSAACNLNCLYCNGATGKKLPGEISFQQIKDTILQAKDLGARSIIIIGGGEPTFYPHFKKLVAFINQLGLIPVLFTNGILLTPGLCRFLYKNNVSVLLKLDSFNEKTQDLLGGKKGTFSKIMSGLQNLLASGFARNHRKQMRLGASFVATGLNYRDIPDIWKFCRDHHIYPNLEQLVPRNRSLKHLSRLDLSREKLFRLKEKLLKLDREKYGYDWLVHAPLSGHGCWQPLYSMYLTSQGYLQPCADITVYYYNIRDWPLKKAIGQPFFKLARNIEKNIGGECAVCKFHKSCIGCRGIAFADGINRGLKPEAALCQGDPLCILGPRGKK